MAKGKQTLLMVGLALLAGRFVAGQAVSKIQDTWVSTWATSQDMAATVPDKPSIPADMKRPDFANMKGPKRPSPNIPSGMENQTVRMIVRTSIGGRKLRVELSNAFGKNVVSIANAHIALRTTGSSIDGASDRQLTFSGRRGFEMRPGVILVSDPVDLDVRPLSDLVVSLHVEKAEGTPANHTVGLHTAYIASGDTTAALAMPEATTTTAYLWLRSVDVVASADDFALACLGDSITDGYATTVDADQAWPTLLANRLSKRSGGSRIAILNEGISGNQVLRDGAGVSALARFDRDVLSLPGVRWVLLLEGINDINLHGQITGDGALSAEDLIAGYKQLIARSHEHHIKMLGATLTPDAGVWLAGPVGEATRQKVNLWVRTSGEFDGVVDFDAATRDKNDPTHLRADFDSSDHIHPNDRGNAAMADAISAKYFSAKP